MGTSPLRLDAHRPRPLEKGEQEKIVGDKLDAGKGQPHDAVKGFLSRRCIVRTRQDQKFRMRLDGSSDNPEQFGVRKIRTFKRSDRTGRRTRSATPADLAVNVRSGGPKTQCTVRTDIRAGPASENTGALRCARAGKESRRRDGGARRKEILRTEADGRGQNRVFVHGSPRRTVRFAVHPIPFLNSSDLIIAGRCLSTMILSGTPGPSVSVPGSRSSRTRPVTGESPERYPGEGVIERRGKAPAIPLTALSRFRRFMLKAPFQSVTIRANLPA